MKAVAEVRGHGRGRGDRQPTRPSGKVEVIVTPDQGRGHGLERIHPGIQRLIVTAFRSENW